MTFELDTLHCNNAGSGEQIGKPAEEAGVPDKESTVGTKLGNPAGEFTFTLKLWYKYGLQTER